jgi:hypothetical protein
MRNAIHDASRVVLIVAVALGVAVSAWAQTSRTGAFASLSPGDQKIARALFEAQHTTQNTSGGATPLTLDQIAEKKKAGHTGWGELFKQMKEQGLVTDKNLGQAVSNFERHHPELAAKPDNSKAEKLDKPDKMDKPDKPEKIEKPAKPERPGR